MVRIYPRGNTLGLTVSPMNAWSFDTVQQQKDAIKYIRIKDAAWDAWA